MQQSKAYIIKSATRNLKSSIAARKAEYVAYRYGNVPNARKISPAPVPLHTDWRSRVYFAEERA